MIKKLLVAASVILAIAGGFFGYVASELYHSGQDWQYFAFKSVYYSLMFLVANVALAAVDRE